MRWLPYVYWSLAGIASVLYGWFALDIFRVERKLSKPELWHERWLNFFGSVVGWVVGWLMIVRHCGWPLQKCGGQPDGWDLIGGLVAFVGVTGYLPYTIVGLISGVHKLAGELIKKALP